MGDAYTREAAMSYAVLICDTIKKESEVCGDVAIHNPVREQTAT